MKFVVVIPARYKSTRFPGKPLVDLCGKSMLLRTYEQCLKVIPENLVLVATEDQRIVDHCKKYNMNVILTSDNCLTGTDRVAEVSSLIDADYYINVQGDEPLFNPNDILTVIDVIDKYEGEIVNGYCEISSDNQYRSLSIPKVVFRPDGRLLYMSRQGIPGNKRGEFVKSWRQVCIYGFPKKTLKAFSETKEKTILEKEEDIEILRFLELGFEVRMVLLSDDSLAVDNPEDVELVKKRILENAK